MYIIFKAMEVNKSMLAGCCYSLEKVGGEKRVQIQSTDHKYGRCGPTAEEPKRSCHGAVDTWEKVVEKASKESCKQEDATGSVLSFREGPSDQD